MDKTFNFEVIGRFHLFQNVETAKRSLGSAAYRPNHQFEEEVDCFIGFMEFESGVCNPGETVNVEIHVVCSDKTKPLFKNGCQWNVKEGNTVVGVVTNTVISSVT